MLFKLTTGALVLVGIVTAPGFQEPKAQTTAFTAPDFIEVASLEPATRHFVAPLKITTLRLDPSGSRELRHAVQQHQAGRSSFAVETVWMEEEAWVQEAGFFSTPQFLRAPTTGLRDAPSRIPRADREKRTEIAANNPPSNKVLAPGTSLRPVARKTNHTICCDASALAPRISLRPQARP